MNERKNGFGFAIACQDPRCGNTVVLRQRKVQLLVFNVRVALRQGKIIDKRPSDALGHAKRINIGAEIPQLLRLNAQQRSGFSGITAVHALQ